MTVAGIKTIKVKPGFEKEFEALFKEMANAILENEPGCLFFELYKRQADPSTYIVLEKYIDEEANTFHKQSSHLAYYSPKIRALFESIELNYLDQIA